VLRSCNSTCGRLLSCWHQVILQAACRACSAIRATQLNHTRAILASSAFTIQAICAIDRAPLAVFNTPNLSSRELLVQLSHALIPLLACAAGAALISGDYLLSTRSSRVLHGQSNAHTQHRYEDAPQLIGHGATISAPHMHAHCLEILKDHLVPGASALDIGSGSG
jgi:hypothetical protein